MGRFKVKLSVTVPAELIADVDRAVKRRRYASRSAAVAAALECWARAERDLEWDEYYRGASDQERGEELAWADLGDESFARAGRAADAPARPGSRRKRR